MGIFLFDTKANACRFFVFANFFSINMREFSERMRSIHTKFFANRLQILIGFFDRKFAEFVFSNEASFAKQGSINLGNIRIKRTNKLTLHHIRENSVSQIEN